MRKLSKGDWLCIAIALLVLQIINFWCLDICVSAVLAGGYLTNGFFISDPMKMYHVALYSSILASSGILFILVHKIVKE